MSDEHDSTLRLFTGVGFKIDSSLTAAIKRTRIGAQQREMEVNWVAEANFHITLNFLGETAVSKLERLEEVLAETCAQRSPLSTSLRGMSAFPDERHARVLWIGVRKSRALGELQDRLRENLVNSGFPLEDREYIPHLTIGRMRKARAATDLLSPYVRTKFGEIEISHVTLFQSVLHGPHTVYKPLKTFELTGQRENETEESL